MRMLHTTLTTSLFLFACGTHSPAEEAQHYLTALGTQGLLAPVPGAGPGVYAFATEQAAEQFAAKLGQLGIEPTHTTFTQTTKPALQRDSDADALSATLVGPIAEWPVDGTIHTCRGELDKRAIPGVGSLFNARTTLLSGVPEWERAHVRVALPDTVPMYEVISRSTPVTANHPSTVFIAEDAGPMRSKHQCGLYSRPRRCNWFECWHVDEWTWTPEVTLVVP